MRRRGRPPTPDVLTPREWEVLELLRAGLTNRQIAERLDISLSGAKHHVSEIIGKLGVKSREEAAALREPASRRWAFAPIGVFASWGHGLASLLTPKVAAATLGGIITGGLMAVVLISGGGEAGVGPAAVLAVPDATATPLPEPCAGRQVCFRHHKLFFASLEAAAEHTSFTPLLPEYMPAGYERRSLGYAWPGDIEPGAEHGFESKGPNSPFEVLYAEYVNATGDVLHVNQGYSVGRGGSYDDAPDHLRGKVTEGGRVIYWYKGHGQWEYKANGLGVQEGRPVEGGWEETSDVTAYWEQTGPSKGTAWEIAPGGTKRVFEARGRPFEYVIISDSLPVEELLKVARSVRQ
jgi:DNA-binding CsgD family transcriptional regulator